MADTLGQPTKAPKKKKTFAFLKSAPKSKSAPDFGDHEKAKGQEDDEDDDLALFKRSKDFFPIIVKEQEEVFREVTPPPKITERKHESDDDGRTPSPIRSSKRRKFSPTPEQQQEWRESTEDLYGAPTPPRHVSESPSPSPSPGQPDLDIGTPRHRSVHEATRSRRSQTKDSICLVQSDLLPTPRRSSSNQMSSHDVISLDDDDSSGGVSPSEHAVSSTSGKQRTSATTSPRTESTPAAIVLDSDEEEEPAPPHEEEDEYAYLIKLAAQKEAAAKAAAAALAGSGPEDEDPSAVDENGNPRKKRVPIVGVKIFIYSRLEEAPALKPFGVKRGITQDLGYVRQHFVHWARSQGAPISEELGDKIFLTWKGRRIYGTSTGISLGWPMGEIQAPPRTPGFARNGILLEAWTEDGFAQYTAEQERQKLIDRGELAEEDEDEAEEEEPKVPRLKLTLKEKDAEPFKTSVFADLQVKILISAYRKQRNIPTDRDIRLRSDGEWLDPQMTLEQSDVEDMCTIEVYLK